MPAEALYTIIYAIGAFNIAFITRVSWYVLAVYIATLVFLIWNIGPVVESKVTYEIKLSNAGYPYYEYKGGICVIDPKQNVKEGDLAVFTTRYRTTKIGLNFEAKTTLEVMSPEDKD